jgi:hypothetical protein
MNRDRESRPKLGSDASFFGDSFSNLEIDDNVRILHNLGLDLAANISPALAFQHDRDRDFRDRDNIMIFLKCLELLVSVEIWPHLASRCEGGGLPLSPQPSILPPSSPPPPHFPPPISHSHILRKRLFSETVFINVFGAQELTRDEFRQPMYPELVFLKSLWGLGTEAEFIPWNRFLCFINVLKYGFLLYIGWRNSFLRRRIDSLAPQTF